MSWTLTSLVNALNGTTAYGLIVARIGGATIRRGAEDIFFAEGYRLPYPVAGAFTIGNVVITAGTFAHLTTVFPRVLVHEARHTRQYAWLGPLFWPVYAVGLIWSWLLTGDRASRNPLERAAGLSDGGYVAKPLRAIWSHHGDPATPQR